MEELSISDFRDLLSKNVESLQKLCKDWEEIYADSSVPDEAKDEIRATIGLTNLLMNQKMKQFQGLIDDSQFKRGEKEITCLDLQGFWDMVYNEVEKVTKNFQKLVKSKENNWTFIPDQDHKVEMKKKTFPLISKTIAVTKKRSSAARQRLAEAKQKMKAQMASKQDKNGDNMDANSDSKTPMSNVTNIQIPVPIEEQTESIINASKIVKSHSKPFEAQEKENLLNRLSSETEVSSTPSTHKKRDKAKEIIPLQCLTRSAKKAMLAKQNGLKD